MQPTTRLVVVAMLLGIATAVHATVLIDRGLPTINLNAAAGSSRSNINWGGNAGNFTGDDFTLPNAAPAYSITGIRTWITTRAPLGTADFSTIISSLTLWLGTAGGTNNVSATPYGFTATRMGYPGSNLPFQSPTFGTFHDIWQIDWHTSGLVLDGGVKYNFGVSGTVLTSDPNRVTTIFNHASNAALGGATADGADDRFSAWNATGGGFASIDSLGNGWDKSSDINVVVSGEPVPEPATLALGLAGLAAAVRRRRARA